MEYVYDDGGRAAAGYKGYAADCVCRAVAIATQRPYQEVYDQINSLAKHERPTRKKYVRSVHSSARDGVLHRTTRKFIASLGWTFVATMGIGTGCKVHLKDGELPGGRLIVKLSKHVVAVIDGVVHDLSDPSREGTRCVYGYWVKEEV